MQNGRKQEYKVCLCFINLTSMSLPCLSLFKYMFSLGTPIGSINVQKKQQQLDIICRHGQWDPSRDTHKGLLSATGV